MNVENHSTVEKIQNIMMTEAIVKTEFGALYLKKLCRHFARKVPTTMNESQGRIEFPFGANRITIDDAQMHLQIEVSNPDEVDTAEKIVTEHLIRMAHKENLTVQWVRNSAAMEQATN